MNEKNKEYFYEIIDGIRANGSTNLNGAL